MSEDKEVEKQRRGEQTCKEIQAKYSYKHTLMTAIYENRIQEIYMIHETTWLKDT